MTKIENILLAAILTAAGASFAAASTQAPAAEKTLVRIERTNPGLEKFKKMISPANDWIQCTNDEDCGVGYVCSKNKCKKDTTVEP